MNGVKNSEGLNLAGWRDRLLLTYDEAAYLLHVNKKTLRRMVDDKELPEPTCIRSKPMFKTSVIMKLVGEEISAEA